MTRSDVLERFAPVTRAWFETSFAEPTSAQSGAWDSISSGDNTLVVAPTGSGKTLAAFLWALDQLVTQPLPEDKERLRTLYVSPLKALAVDIERNLRSPLAGIKAAGARLGEHVPHIDVGVRTGDTPQEERRRFPTAPPDILITTPESLFLLLTSRAREALRSIETVIVDEVHAVAGTKRGSHLALSLERLDELLGAPAQRIGLSATVRPTDEVARFLGGGGEVRVVAPPSDKRFDLNVVVPLEDMMAPDIEPPGGREKGPELVVHEGSAAAPEPSPEARNSVWPHVEARLLSEIRAHKSTIVFVNSRRLAERLANRLNDLAGEEIVRSHHGSVARDQRVLIEEELKAGRLPAVVATSSLELGIDMGAVDLVVQVGAPDTVASGLQRIGRAGHQVGAVSHGLFLPRFRGDLLETAVVAERMKIGAIEATTYPRNPLDVLAQQIVAMVAMDDWVVDELQEVVRRAAPFAELPRSALESVLDMLSGRYPSDEFAELRPRLNWDRATGVLTGRPNAQRLAVTSGGTIPDRGLFGVFIAGERGARVGELDEEMVYESRPGEVFLLGASSWLIEDITHDRVLVTPAPGQPGRMPFWHGDAPGRPLELGRALGAFVRELTSLDEASRKQRLYEAGLDDYATGNLLTYLDEQREATGSLPDDRTIVVERFQDELGDLRVCIHTFFGAKIHAPWAQAIESRVRERHGIEVQCIYSDDGIVVRLPEAQDSLPTEEILLEPDEVEDAVVGEVGGSALFASRFRECAARALLLPKRDPARRTPLWQQRQRSANLLQVASKYGSFPVILETFRECLQDVFDLPALQEVMGSIEQRKVRVVDVETQFPSPFASSLQFGYVSAFMYEGDAPLAERRAQALSLDRSLLAELMGSDELRELIDADALEQTELELQALIDERKARDPDGLHDLLRRLGDLTVAEAAARSREPDEVGLWLTTLHESRRAIEVRVAGEERWIAIEDSSRYRDALGTALPPGVPDAFQSSVDDPLGDIVARYARTHGPFGPGDVAGRLGLGRAVVEKVLRSLVADGRVVEGEFRPGGMGAEWIGAEVLRRLRRRSLAALRKEIEPAPPEALARSYLAWQSVGPHGYRSASAGAVYRVIEQLQGVPIPASVLESQVLPARIPGYQPAILDQLGASGEIVWCGAGASGERDGWIALAPSDGFLLPPAQEIEPSSGQVAILEALAGGGGLFFRHLSDEVGSTDDGSLLPDLWDLVWAGLVTNDTLAPVRALLGGGRKRRQGGGARARGPALPERSGPATGAGRWSLVRRTEITPTRRMVMQAEQLLARYGIVTRNAVVAERIPGGFAGIYPVFKAMEDSGRCRRGYFVEGLGGAQFALPGAVDRMRTLVAPDATATDTQVLAATDPANPYGAALPWPSRDGHRAGRKAGATVVLVNGSIVAYVEKGGRSLLTYTDDEEILGPAVDALALAAREGLLGRLHVERADGEAVEDTALARALIDAGFRPSSKGLRLRA